MRGIGSGAKVYINGCMLSFVNSIRLLYSIVSHFPPKQNKTTGKAINRKSREREREREAHTDRQRQADRQSARQEDTHRPTSIGIGESGHSVFR